MCGIQRVLRNPMQSVWYINNAYILSIDQNSNNPLIDVITQYSHVKPQVMHALITCMSINMLCCATSFTYVSRFNHM